MSHHKHFAHVPAFAAQYAVINGRLDEDLYQELCITLMRAIDLSGFKSMRKALRSLSQGLSRGLKIDLRPGTPCAASCSVQQVYNLIYSKTGLP